MRKFYQIVNFQFQPVPMKWFENLDDAKNYIVELQKTYADETFYIVELHVVHSAIVGR